MSLSIKNKLASNITQAKRVIRHIPIFFLLCASIPVLSAPGDSGGTVSISKDRDLYAVNFELLEDIKGTLTFEEAVASPNFHATEKTGFGFTKTVFWTRFTVKIPESNSREWYLEIGYPLLDIIDIYIPDMKNGYVKKRYGDHLPFSKRDIDYHNFIIHLKSKPGSYTYYIRFQTESSMSIPMTILSQEKIISVIDNHKTIFGLFYGALLLVFFYNLLLSISMRDLTYFFYATFIAALVLVSLGLNGYGFQYIWPNTLWMNNQVPLMLFLSILTLGVFTFRYVDYEIVNPTIIKIIYVYMGFITLGAVLSPILPYSLMIKIGAGSYLPGIAIILCTGIDLVRKKSRPTIFYAIAFSALLVGVIATVFHRFGIAQNEITLWGFQIGTVISIALFSLGLSDKVNTLTNELVEINYHLEEKVEERTKELSDAKEEIEAAMEELEAINERLTDSNQQLEDAKDIHEKDLLIASYVQSSFLPSTAPKSDIYDIAYIYRPASGVSGDFYDFYIVDNVLHGLGLFDVSGHGISSALLTLMARSIIYRTFSKLKNEKLTSLINIMNERLISEIKTTDHYLTGIILRFRGDEIDYVNCAHPDMLCKKIETGVTTGVMDYTGKKASGPILGIEIVTKTSDSDASFEEITLTLDKGDALFLYTDSLSESCNDAGMVYGEERIISSLKKSPDSSAGKILENMMKDFYDFMGSIDNLSDDLTAILIKRK